MVGHLSIVGDRAHYLENLLNTSNGRGSDLSRSLCDDELANFTFVTILEMYFATSFVLRGLGVG